MHASGDSFFFLALMIQALFPIFWLILMSVSNIFVISVTYNRAFIGLFSFKLFFCLSTRFRVDIKLGNMSPNYFLDGTAKKTHFSIFISSMRFILTCFLLSEIRSSLPHKTIRFKKKIIIAGEFDPLI